MSPAFLESSCTHELINNLVACAVRSITSTNMPDAMLLNHLNGINDISAPDHIYAMPFSSELTSAIESFH